MTFGANKLYTWRTPKRFYFCVIAANSKNNRIVPGTCCQTRQGRNKAVRMYLKRNPNTVVIRDKKPAS
jgi:hypothetical protein